VSECVQCLLSVIYSYIFDSRCLLLDPTRDSNLYATFCHEFRIPLSKCIAKVVFNLVNDVPFHMRKFVQHSSTVTFAEYHNLLIVLVHS